MFFLLIYNLFRSLNNEIVKYQIRSKRKRGDHGSEIEGQVAALPNSYWVADHHACVPIWYGWQHADKDLEMLLKLLLNDHL